VERRVRVWWDGNGDWFDADVVGYDKDKKLHLLQYCADGDQSYEDLAAYVERGLKTTAEQGQAALPTAAAAGYEGLLFGGPCDAVRYWDAASGEEMACTVWELLNENEKATPDMVGARVVFSLTFALLQPSFCFASALLQLCFSFAFALLQLCFSFASALL
jgi:hypothetical protein